MKMPKIKLTTALNIAVNGTVLAALAYVGYRGAELSDDNAQLITMTQCEVSSEAGQTRKFVYPAPLKSGVQSAWDSASDAITAWWTGQERPANQTNDGAIIMPSHEAAYMATLRRAETYGPSLARADCVSELFVKNSLVMRLIDPADSSNYGQHMDIVDMATAEDRREWAEVAKVVEQDVRTLQGPPPESKSESLEGRAATWAYNTAWNLVW